MWQRQQQQPQPHHYEPQMSYSAYPDQSMPDERYLETIHEVESLYSRRNSVAATGLSDQHYRAVAPMAQQRESVTSIYSNEPVSPMAPEHPSQYAASQSTVSPISSHERLPATGSNASLVSPIESSFPSRLTQASPPSQQQTSGFKSHLPRRLPLANAQPSPDQPNSKRTSREIKADTKWDDYSGEPSETGKPAFAKNAPAPPLTQQYPQLKERTRQILEGLKEKEAVKKSSWAKGTPVEEDPLDNPVQRPAWKGASGRSALVEPVKNTPSARTKPLLLLQRNRKKDVPKVQVPQPIPQSPTEEITPTSPINAVSIAASQLTPTIRSVASEEDIRPVAPLKGRYTPRILSPTTLEHKDAIKALDSPFHSPGPAHHPIYDAAPKPLRDAFPNHPGDSPTRESVRSLNPPDRSSSEDSVLTAQASLQREPDTSSSWNTYASTGTAPDPSVSRELSASPAPMNMPPLPIMLRKRVAANNSAISPFSAVDNRHSVASILRKPVADKPRALSIMSTSSISKSLPPTPVEVEASDKVVSLEARLESFERRKHNVNKIIYEKSEDLRKNAIVYNAHKRREVEKQIVNLKLELQDITNEEHEVGLKLHRVQKRRDKDDFYEKPTGLWIKRVTS